MLEKASFYTGVGKFRGTLRPVAAGQYGRCSGSDAWHGMALLWVGIAGTERRGIALRP